MDEIGDEIGDEMRDQPLHSYRSKEGIYSSEKVDDHNEGLLWEACCHCGRRWKIYSSVPARMRDLRAEELHKLRDEFFGPDRTYDDELDQFQETYEEEFFEPAFDAFHKQGCGYFGIDCEEPVAL